ncbi:hypothetical protein RR46_08600 [Papilio xuthus]|uniref:Uncharacterized protein n=1 Tax=Papilio xuthus TaxID=66420 RepID=A0A194Q7R8_PAPXU|nr:hypothetical protein RR46_08600 [Papilio xuthus]
MQVSSDKQIPGLVKSNGNGDFIDGCQEKRTKDGLLTRRRHSENIIYDCQNNVRKYNSEIKDMKMCIELSQQLTQNTVDNRSVVSALVTTTNPKDDVQVKYKTRIDSASKYTLKRSKNIKHEVCTKCKEILKYIDRFLNNNNDKIMISPRQKLPESVHDISKLNNQSNKLDILNEQKKTCVDAKQNVQTNIGCQNTLPLDKSRCEIVLNNNKSTSKENSTNKKNFDKNKIEQSVSSYKTSDKDNSTVVCNKPVSSKFNSDAMCYFVDLDTCPSYVCPDKCGPPKSPKHFCFRKKVDVGIDTDCCFKRSLFNRIGNFFSCINAKFRCRQNNQNVECGKPLKDARNQTKKLTINIKKEPVCIIFENASGCNDKSPNIFGKFPKKKVAFRDECVNLPKGLVAIKIDPNNKRVINKRELKSILKSLPKREIKNCPIPASTSKVEVQTILKQRSSPIATACKGPMFVLKIDRNNMRILNYPEVKCKISNLNKMCAKNVNCESWVVTKGKCNKKQKVRSVESKMSLWDRYHRSKSKSPSAPVKKKHSEGKIDKKPSQKCKNFFLYHKVANERETTRNC